MFGKTTFAGALHARVIRPPKAPMSWRIQNAIRPSYWQGYLANKTAKTLSALTGIPTLTAELSIRLTRRNGDIVDYGVVGYKVVTTAFVNFLVDQLQAETSVIGDFKFHDSGVGTTAENVADTDIETTDGEARATGTQTEGASANIYRSVGTISYTTNKAITEHGLFNDITAGTLADRTVFSAINVINGDSVAFTYELTVAAGS